jgi:hypothetical protein
VSENLCHLPGWVTGLAAAMVWGLAVGLAGVVWWLVG